MLRNLAERAGAALTLRRAVTAGCAVLSLSGLLLCAMTVNALGRGRPQARDFGAASFSPRVVPLHSKVVPLHGLTSPVRIEIPALAVVTTISVVVTVDGRLSVPPDPMTVGWWPGAALPGSTSGAVVLDGHVDSATRGPGAFFRLTELRAGDFVIVTTAGGDRVRYRVTARRSYAKAAGLPTSLFSGDGPPRLVLITCGGQFDATATSYRDNIVVYAKPMAGLLSGSPLP